MESRELKGGWLAEEHRQVCYRPLMIPIQLRAFVMGECRRWPQVFVMAECRRWLQGFATGEWHHCQRTVVERGA